MSVLLEVVSILTKITLVFLDLLAVFGENVT